jgi:hypothetical protein
MGEVALARLWHLPDGTICLLLKDSSTETWEIRIERSRTVVKSERFSSPIVAMEEAKQWRAMYDPAMHAIG